jgi:hypothetical protein
MWSPLVNPLKNKKIKNLKIKINKKSASLRPAPN